MSIIAPVDAGKALFSVWFSSSEARMKSVQSTTPSGQFKLEGKKLGEVLALFTDGIPACAFSGACQSLK
jgi:hypothetical protein